MSPASPGSVPRPVDPRALARIRSRLQREPSAPWLHTEVARRMGERLTWIRRRPTTWIDWHAHRGGGTSALRGTYPDARGLTIEDTPPPSPNRPWWRLWPREGRGASSSLPGAVPEASAELLWSNMSLHFEPDPGEVFRQWRRALAVDGFLMFSTLGPGTLLTLRDLYRDAGWGVPFAPAVDMHDLGDLLVEAGFAEPVMDQEVLTLTWPQPEAVLTELRTLGGNAAADRFAGLRTPRWRARLLDALASRRGTDGRIALAFEVVYGHAFCPAPRIPMQQETRIDPQALRRAAQQGARTLKKRGPLG